MNIQQKPPVPMTIDQFFASDGGGHVGMLELVEGIVRAMSPASAGFEPLKAHRTKVVDT